MIAGLMLAFLPLAVSPESEGVSSKGLLDWIDACEQKIDCLHGFVLLRHGKLIAEGSWKPFDTLEETHFLSSHSKCFVTTAIGFLVDDGKLDLDERVVDILPDKMPPKPAEWLQQMRVRALLTMTSGAKDEGWTRDRDGDWTKAFLANEMVQEPGRQFKYNSGGTHVLGMIVSRKAGMPLMDFLKQRLFDKIGIEKAWTTCDPCGNACAGWGMSMTTREISLIGQLYLNGGVWNGERLLSDDWVRMATSKQTWSGKTPEEFQPENDWLQGFGFNWWRCQHGCFRADGSGGQYTIVFPQFDAVLSLHADVRNMQEVLDVVWARLLPVFSSGALPEDAVAAGTLRERCGTLALPPVVGRREGAYEKCLGRRFDFSKAPTGIQGVCLDVVADGWRLRLSTDAGEQDLPVGFGEWKFGEVKFSKRRHQPLGELVGVQRVASSAAVQDDGSILVKVHVLGGPRRIELRFGRKFFLPYVEGCMVGAATFTSGLL